MIDFMQELEKFEEILDVEYIEDKIDADDMKDLMDILKDFTKRKEGQGVRGE